MNIMTKRILSLFLSLMMFFSSLPTALAETWPDDDFTLPIDQDDVPMNIDEPFMEEPGVEEEFEPDDEPGPMPEEPTMPDDLFGALEAHGHAYIGIAGTPVIVYITMDMTEGSEIYAVWQEDALLLATEYVELETAVSVKAWLATEQLEVLTGYVNEDDLADVICPDEEVYELLFLLPSSIALTEDGERYTFVVQGEALYPSAEEPAMPEQDEPISQAWPEDIQQGTDVVEEFPAWPPMDWWMWEIPPESVEETEPRRSTFSVDELGHCQPTCWMFCK